MEPGFLMGSLPRARNYYEMFIDCSERALHAELKQQSVWPGVSNPLPQYYSSCQNVFFFSQAT